MMSLLRRREAWWSAWVVAALLLLTMAKPTLYGVIVPLSALMVALIPGALPTRPASRGRVDRLDLLVVVGLYLGVVVLFRLAFVYFTVTSVVGLFLCFAGALLLGVAGPIGYTVWIRHRTLRTLGLRLDNWRQTAALGLVFAAVQFLVTFAGFDLPTPADWVPLLVMSITVGLFEAVFFRGFVLNRLEASFGPVLGVGGAALLYALYHVGYGMESVQMVFLFGLGVVYAVAFRIVDNILVVWPLLTPMGGFFANLTAGDIKLPWASIAGFGDVLVLMAAAVIIAVRRERKQRARAAATPTPAVVRR